MVPSPASSWAVGADALAIDKHQGDGSGAGDQGPEPPDEARCIRGGARGSLLPAAACWRRRRSPRDEGGSPGAPELSRSPM